MKRFLTIAAAIFVAVSAYADEGMWMVNSISRALVLNMQQKGLQLEADEIYNVDKVSLADAIVSLDFGCSGSIVSDRGLLITNHHCAYSDVHALSTPDRNYLEDGFWAYSDDQEIYIPGKSIYFLEKVLDVTDEVKEMIQTEGAAGRPMGMRRISYKMEKKYSEETGLEASLSSMWAGSHYYMALYTVYTDIRLVAAPPVSIAAFGGDEDNWEWPQHKCDFAMYRIYAAPDGSPAPHSDANVPLVPRRRLKVSDQGYNFGDFAMVIGYPGKTDRYASSAKINYEQTLSLPIENKVRGAQMEIIKKWMDADPAVRLKYADRFFSLSNVQELQVGEVDCYKRFGVVKDRRRMERHVKECKDVARRLDSSYKAVRSARKNAIYYRETLVRGTRLALVAARLKNHNKDFSYEKEYAELDMRVEKELFRYSVQAYYDNVDSVCWGPYQRDVREMFYDPSAKTCNYDKLCDYLWTDDYMTKEDGIFKFFSDVTMAQFNQEVEKALGGVTLSSLNTEYTCSLYRHRADAGELQYPDANSTMRLSYGTVSTFRRDCTKLPWQTFSDEILSKEDESKYDFTLKDEWRKLLSSSEERIPVDFITDNDITGGNSGSPVLNGKGELIGLAFDGNKESLASDKSFTPGYNKCVCVDIRFVLWTLRNYAHLDRVIDEMM